MAEKDPNLSKTVLSVPSPKLLSDDPFNRLRWALNEIQGKWEAAVRGLLDISKSTDLNKARKLATETLHIMAQTQEERKSQ
jgi:hypothetical protein